MEHSSEVVKRTAVEGVGDDTFPASVYRMISSSKLDRLMNAANSLCSDMQLKAISLSSLRATRHSSKGSLQSITPSFTGSSGVWNTGLKE